MIIIFKLAKKEIDPLSSKVDRITAYNKLRLFLNNIQLLSLARGRIGINNNRTANMNPSKVLKRSKPSNN